MIDYKKLYSLLPRMHVVREYDLQGRFSNYAIDMDAPDIEHDGRRTVVMRFPDGCVTPEYKAQAQLLALSPLMLELITKHCEWCADCPFDTDPDLSCGEFAEFWRTVINIYQEAEAAAIKHKNEENAIKED